MREDVMASLLSDTDVIIKNPNGSKLSDYVMHTDKLDRDSSSLTDLIPDVSVNPAHFAPAFGDTPACCVCHGVGYVGGFTPYRGERIILDTTEPSVESDHGYIDPQFYPNRLLLEDGATAIWTITIPKSIARLDALQLWDNESPIPYNDYLVEVEYEGSWVVISGSDLLTYATGLPQRIRVSPLILSLRFSHLEIQISYSKTLLRIDFPNLPNELSYNVYDNLSSLTLIIPPSVAYLHKYSVVRESLYGSLWRLTSISYVGDYGNQQHGWSTTARLVQPYELVNTLPTLGQVRSLVGLPLRAMTPQPNFRSS